MNDVSLGMLRSQGTWIHPTIISRLVWFKNFLPLQITTWSDFQPIFLRCKKLLVNSLKGWREIEEENTKGLFSLSSRKYLFIYIVFNSLEGCCRILEVQGRFDGFYGQLVWLFLFVINDDDEDDNGGGDK